MTYAMIGVAVNLDALTASRMRSAELPQPTQYDEALGCFVQLDDSRASGQQYGKLAFCYDLPALTHSGENFARNLTSLLDSLASDSQFYGATLRFGVCANPFVGEVASERPSAAVELEQIPCAMRKEVLQRRALYEARHMVAPEATVASEASHYDFFVYGAIPVDLKGIDHALATLKALNDKTVALLCDGVLGSGSLDGDRYRRLTDRILNVSVNTVTDPARLSVDVVTDGALAGTKAFGVQIATMGADQILGSSIPRQPTFFESWNWNAGNGNRPQHFLLTTTYRIVDRATYKKLVLQHSAPVRMLDFLRSEASKAKQRREMAYAEQLLEAVEQGNGMVAVDVAVYGLGDSGEAAEAEAKRFVHFMRAQKFTGQFRYEGLTEVRSILPMESSRCVNKLPPNLVTIGHAVAFAPTMGRAVQIDNHGLRLQTILGQPAWIDFVAATDSPLTVIAGPAGTGKSLLISAMAMYSLSRRMPVFAITDNTFAKQQVKYLGGQYNFGNDAAGKGLSPFNLRKETNNDKVILLASMYLWAVASLFIPIPAVEKIVVEKWIRQYCAQLLAVADSTVGIDLPSILDAMRVSGVVAPTVYRSLAPFARNGAYSNLVSRTWQTELSRDEFTVVTDRCSQLGIQPPHPVEVVDYLTKIAFASNMVARQDKNIPAALFFEGIDLLLQATPEIAQFTEMAFSDCRAHNCAIITTVYDANLLQNTALGKWLVISRQNFVCLKQSDETIGNPAFREMLDMTPERDFMYKNIQKMPNFYSEMVMHSGGRAGLYRLCLSPFARAMADHKLVACIGKELECGASYLQAIESICEHDWRRGYDRMKVA